MRMQGGRLPPQAPPHRGRQARGKGYHGVGERVRWQPCSIYFRHAAESGGGDERVSRSSVLKPRDQKSLAAALARLSRAQTTMKRLLFPYLLFHGIVAA